MPVHGADQLFVTGTDTGVGKTQVAAALLRAMVQRGYHPWAMKPFESGGDADSDALWEAAGRQSSRSAVTLYRFDAPLAPGVAAKLERRRVDWRSVVAKLRAQRGPGVAEGAGGLYVPLDARHDVIDLIAAIEFDVILVARAGLGTLNHTSLSLRALAERGANIRGVVLSCTVPHGRDVSLPHNRSELERRFPSVRFVGPVPYLKRKAVRDAAFDDAVSPLL